MVFHKPGFAAGDCGYSDSLPDRYPYPKKCTLTRTRGQKILPDPRVYRYPYKVEQLPGYYYYY